MLVIIVYLADMQSLLARVL